MRYALFGLGTSVVLCWFLLSLCFQVECSGRTMDGSTFTWRGFVFTAPDLGLSHEGVLERIVKDGEWHVAEFARDFGIDPRADRERIACRIKARPLAWFPLRFGISGPELEFAFSVADQYNDPELRARIKALGRNEVMERYNRGSALR